MNLAEKFKPLIAKVRGLPGKSGLRTHSVSILLSDYSGSHTGDGTRADIVTALLESGQNPKVSWLNSEALAVGDLAAGSIKVGPLTADHGAVQRLADIQGTDMDIGETRYLTITGPKHPDGATYRITDIKAHKAMHYSITAAPVQAEQ